MRSEDSLHAARVDLDALITAVKAQILEQAEAKAAELITAAESRLKEQPK